MLTAKQGLGILAITAVFVVGCASFSGQSADEQLLRASSSGDLDEVTRLVESGADLYTTNTFEQTALHLATQSGEIEVVRYLLSAGMDVNTPGRFGTSAITIAAAAGNLGLVELFVEKGADLRPEGERSVLFDAILNNSPEVADYLLEVDTGDLSNESLILHAAASTEMWDIIPRLIDRGAPTTTTEGRGRGVLRFASSDVDTIMLLVEAGADVNNIPDDGVPPATAAITEGHLESALYLLGNGASINPVYMPPKEDGRTPLPPLFGAALSVDDQAFFEQLLSLGADPNYIGVDDDGAEITALQILILNGKEDLAIWLVENGASPDTADQRQMLLDTATEKNMTRLAERL